MSDTYWAFFWPVKEIEHRDYIQLACFWLELRKSAHKLAQSSRVPRFQALQFQAKIISAIKVAGMSTKHLESRETARKLSNFLLDKAELIPSFYMDLIYEINRRNNPRWS